MADLVIRGMEMPKKDEILVFDVWHAKLYARSTANTGTRRYEVVQLPEGHGKLIDADALLNDKGVGTQIAGWGKMFHETTIAYAPTIVPAEGGGEK